MKCNICNKRIWPWQKTVSFTTDKAHKNCFMSKVIDETLTFKHTESIDDRVGKFRTLQMPGQGMSMHMGTYYLVNDLHSELKKLRKICDSYHYREWMDVKEDQPKEDQECLCLFGDGNWMAVAKYTTVFGKLEFIANAIVTHPTHWQPLPTTPKNLYKDNTFFDENYA